jgi:hypothetical protein
VSNVLITVAIILLVVAVTVEWFVPAVPGWAVVAISLALLGVTFLTRGRT